MTAIVVAMAASLAVGDVIETMGYVHTHSLPGPRGTLRRQHRVGSTRRRSAGWWSSTITKLLRAGTRRILDDATGFTVVGEADDGEAALRVIAETQPDVVLVDIRLPSINGIDLARSIVERNPAPPCSS